MSQDIFGHGSGDESLGSAVRLPLQQLHAWQLGGQRQRGQGVHNQIDPQHLDGLQGTVL